MASVVKRSLKVPIKKLTGCVTGEKDRARHRTKTQSGGRGGRRFVKSDPPRSGHSRRSSVTCPYQAELEKERKRREARNARRTAERAAMRSQLRRKHHLSKNAKDAKQISVAGGRVKLPPELAKIGAPQAKSKDDGNSLLRAFQGLSLKMGVASGSKQRQPRTQTPASADSCRVM